MKQATNQLLILIGLVVASFSGAAWLAPQGEAVAASEGQGSLLTLLFGEGRKVVGSYFLRQADVTFHSGYYPTIFDGAQEPTDRRYMTSTEGSPEDEQHDREMDNFFKEPPRWDLIARFGRHFMITEHTHLKEENQREILPWLKLSAELDPQNVQTYTVGAYFLRAHLHKPEQAEKFLRQGLRANPNSYEILYELGRLNLENLKNPFRARNLLGKALKCWDQEEGQKPEKERNLYTKEEIITHLALSEKEAGDIPKAIEYFEMAKKLSPNPQAIQNWIDELKHGMR
ncbi:MAG: hypothetical protein C5B50_30470 [Verrucomicrobia bacterium]|nr:MAG: hypothetical protein C5B50_30470 [Verrucomicrobiota bacterium]